MSTILIIVVVLLLLGGGGGYYAHGRYGGAGLASFWRKISRGNRLVVRL